MGGGTNSDLGIPQKYDKRYRINISMAPKDLERLLRQHQSRHRSMSDTDILTVERLEQFRGILLHYLDFVQKQKVSDSLGTEFMSMIIDTFRKLLCVFLYVFFICFQF